MAPHPDSRIALLRGINVGGRNPLAMTDLVKLALELGWRQPLTWIQSGNLVFRAKAAPQGLARMLEVELLRRHGLLVPVIVCSGTDWAGHAERNPFPDASGHSPNLVMLAVAQAAPAGDCVQQLLARAENGEQVVQVGSAVWIHYAGGAGRSKISPGLLDRAIGSPTTTRNWRTVVKLGELAAAPSAR